MGEMGEIISQEMGAPLWMAQRAQAGAGIGHFMTARRVLSEFEFEKEMGTTLVVREPIGVCALITPWNWPINQIACKVAPALAAGCTMVLKPSEVAPLNAILFAEILEEAGVPAGVFNLVNGDGVNVGSAAVVAPRRRHGVVHRLDARRRRGRQVGGPDRQAGVAGARRQVGQHHPRRRRLRQGHRPRHGRDVQQLRPVVQRADAHARAGGPHGRGGRHRRRGGEGRRRR